MRTFLLTDNDYSESDIGATFMFVIQAPDEATARAMAAKSSRRKSWSNPALRECEELTGEGEARIIAEACVNP